MATNQALISQRVYLLADVPNGGTVTVPYPTGYGQADLTGANAGLTSDNEVIVNDNDTYRAAQVTFAYGASNVTVTNNSGVIWKANAAGGNNPNSGYIRCSFPRPNNISIYGGKSTLVDNSGGVIGSPIPAIAAGAAYAQADMVAVKNALATIVAAMRQGGILN